MKAEYLLNRMMESGESEKVNFMNSVKCILKKYNKMQQYQIKNFAVRYGR